MKHYQLINLLHEQYPKWKFISLIEPENVPSMALLKKLGYKDAGYDTGTESQIFEKWTGSAATERTRGDSTEFIAVGGGG